MRTNKFFIRCGLTSAVFASILFTFAGELHGQSSRTSTSTARRVGEFNKQGEKALHDEMNREMRRKKPSKEALRKAAQIKRETIKDLETLQSNYNSMILRLAERTMPEQSFIKETTDSTESAAARLLANLALPKPDEKAEPDRIEAVEADIRLRMRALCGEIYALLTSPAVENPNVVDIDAAAAAHKRLERIIHLSELVRTAQQ